MVERQVVSRRRRPALRPGWGAPAAAGLALAPSGAMAVSPATQQLDVAGAVAEPRDGAPGATAPSLAEAAHATAALLAEVAQAEPTRPDGAPDEAARSAAGSAGLVLPLPPLAAEPPAAVPLPAAPDPGVAVAALPPSPLPPELDTSDVDAPDDEAASIAEGVPAPDAAVAPAAPAMLSASFRPLLKNAGMLGTTTTPVLTLELPLARVAEAAARRDQVMLDGTAGADTLWGGAGDDRLAGGAGDDVLFGGLGADTLLGGEGDDVLLVTGGTKVMTGGPGRDLFVIGLPDLLREGLGRITDFESGQDALLVAVGPRATDGYGWLSWYSRTMTIGIRDRWDPIQPNPPESFGVLVDYPARQFWVLSVETPRIRDLWMSAGPSDIIVADPNDPANARIIERPDGEGGIYLPRVMSPPASDFDLL